MRREFWFWPDDTRTGDPTAAYVEIDAPFEVDASRSLPWHCTARIVGLWRVVEEWNLSGLDGLHAWFRALAVADVTLKSLAGNRISRWREEYDPVIFPELASAKSEPPALKSVP